MSESRETILSPCRTFRYTLWRPVIFTTHLMGVFTDPPPTEKQKQYVNFICLNPSKADETLDDPTIRRVVGFAKSWGYGAVCMTNLFAFRATDPDDMQAARDPIGPENDEHLLKCAERAGIIVAAWGAHGNYRYRANGIKTRLERQGFKLHALHINADGSPKHPLYIKADAQPIPFV